MRGERLSMNQFFTTSEAVSACHAGACRSMVSMEAWRVASPGAVPLTPMLRMSRASMMERAGKVCLVPATRARLAMTVEDSGCARAISRDASLIQSVNSASGQRVAAGSFSTFHARVEIWLTVMVPTSLPAMKNAPACGRGAQSIRALTC